MSYKRNMTGLGAAPGLAAAIAGSVNTSTSAAGTLQTDAAMLPFVSHHHITTGASNSGVIIPPGTGTTDGMAAGDWFTISNQTGNTIKLWPPTGGKLNNGSANASVSLTSNQNAFVRSLDGTSAIVIIV